MRKFNPVLKLIQLNANMFSLLTMENGVTVHSKCENAGSGSRSFAQDLCVGGQINNGALFPILLR